MLQAFSHLKKSQGAGVVNYLNTFLGLDFTKNGVKKSSGYARLVQKYQNQITEKAYNDPDWKIYYDLLIVYLAKDNSIKIKVNGDEQLIEEIKLLEFGDGENPARPFIRTNEAQLNEDFAWRRAFKL